MISIKTTIVKEHKEIEELERRLMALIWDQAGFHKSGELVAPANITIIELPAYSPELNPVENLWQYLRSHYWANRSYENYDALREAACDGWQAVCLDEKLIQNSYIERKNFL